MKPVFQTRHGIEDGNCLAACLASILEVPLEKIDFVGSRGDWLEKTNKALSPFGFCYVAIALPLDTTIPVALQGAADTFCVFVGSTERNKGTDALHCVVGLVQADGEKRIKYVTYHDPFAEDAPGLLNGQPTELGFLVPRNPHHWVHQP